MSIKYPRLEGASAFALYEAVRDNARYHVWSADRFYVPPGDGLVFQLRAIPRRYFDEACEDGRGSIALLRRRAFPVLEVVR